jgi:hypothetical protein
VNILVKNGVEMIDKPFCKNVANENHKDPLTRGDKSLYFLSSLFTGKIIL